MSGLSESTENDKRVTVEFMVGSAALIGRRYLLHEQLGVGGMGAVYRAMDRLTGQTVALKQVTTEDALSDHDDLETSTHLRIALAQEFKVLASLRHPNVIGVLDYGFANRISEDSSPQPYFTMELLAHARTVQEAGYQKPLPVQIDLLIQMLQALSYVHRRGIIHRDLKPNNALVTRDTTGELAVKVLDFGLSARRDQTAIDQEQVVGTLTYIAPEMLQGQPASEVSDLYAVGVIAYEMFAGRHPFDLTNTTRLIRDILTMPPDVWSLDVSEDLVMVLERLLDKNPAHRYQSADAVIAALCHAMERPLPQETAAIRESYLQAAQLVGRTAELDTLSRSLTRTLTSGKGSTWLIGGESGVGKSRLVDELRTLALVDGALVLRGQAISEGGHPYELWRDVMRWMALLTDVKDLEADALKTIVPDIAALLNRDIPENTQTDAFQARDFLLSVVETLFQRFTTGRAHPQPLVLMLEDLHWATGESLLLLRRVNALTEELPLMVIASYRDDERVYLPTELPDMQVLKLERLNLDEIEQLSAAMLGETGRREEIIDFLQRETEGNIFFLVEVVRALAEEAGRLGNIGLNALPHDVMAGGVQIIVQRRLERVPAHDRDLLRVAAVLGRWIDLDLLGLLAAPDVLERWLDDCANVAVLDVQEGRWRFSHDKLRDVLLHEMSEDDKRAVFRRVAQAIEHAAHLAGRHEDERAAQLAYLWGMAGEADKERLYAAQAGRYALSQASFPEAVNHFERAVLLTNERIEQGSDSHHASLAELKQKLGQAYFGLGEFARAEELHEESRALYQSLDDLAGVARALNQLGDVAFARSDFEAARRLQTESATLAREIGDQRTFGNAQADLGRVSYVAGDYRYAQQLFNRALEIARELGDDRSEAKLLNSLGSVAHDLGEFDEANMLCDESARMCRKLGDRQGVAAAYNGLGLIAKTRGQYAEAERHYGQAIALSEEIGDQPGLAVATQRLGDVAFELEDYTRAKTHYQTAKGIFSSIGDKRGSVTALNGLGNVGRMQQDYAYAAKVYEEVLATYRELGDRRGVVTALNNLGNATCELGQGREAWKYYRSALRDAMRMGVVPLVLDVLDGMAGLLVSAGDYEDAAELVGFILSHPSIEKQGQNVTQGLLTRLETELSADTLAAAQSRGRGQSLQAVAERLMNTSAGKASTPG
ncbi:MAG: tetratricopeptide repeat protein [bacterium]|nr:tetratricopeptide repeat protein [bacterium]